MMIATITDLQKLYDEYYAGLAPLYSRIVENHDLAGVAANQARRDMEENTFESWKSYEYHIKGAIEDFGFVVSAVNRKAASHRKPDLLSEEIQEILRSRPNIKASELPEELERRKPNDVIIDVTATKIVYASSRTNLGAPLKEAPIAGLKDRLSKAKKAVSRTR